MFPTGIAISHEDSPFRSSNVRNFRKDENCFSLEFVYVILRFFIGFCLKLTIYLFLHVLSPYARIEAVRNEMLGKQFLPINPQNSI